MSALGGSVGKPAFGGLREVGGGVAADGREWVAMASVCDDHV
jgi:hypothetical protein